MLCGQVELRLSRATQNLRKWNPAFAIHVADKVGLRLYSKSEYKAAHGPIPWLDQLFTYAYQTAHQSRQRQTSKKADKYYSMANFLFTSLFDCVAASLSSASAYLLFGLLVAVSELRKGPGNYDHGLLSLD
jgi:hypothetical protein